MQPGPVIEFRHIAWDELQAFLARERSLINRDVDQDVRFMNYVMYAEQRVEGLCLDGELVGFARWDIRTRHLSNLYVTPSARGHGVGRKFIQDRQIDSLYVMPHNHEAKKLYSRLGFHQIACAVPSREYMIRPKYAIAGRSAA